ncbi:ABC transporter permease [Flammeovirgaceae bacterium SG7u.111]|nr:ABC transporter permease [Flammeovirgaceae bacterium SG7u.132]WPO36301.1 ABC transporter permease [Flammeovirgaceae bacterium SG7u.111]
MLRFLLEKEFKQFFRNSFVPRMVIMFPLTALLIYPMVTNFEVKNINLSLVDHDKGSYTRTLVQKVIASGYFNITDVSSNYEEALASIEADEADLILEIPANFEKNLVKESASTLMISANAVNGNKGGLGTAYLARIISDYNADIRMELMGTHGSFQSSFLSIIPLYRYNPSLLYSVFMVPAIMVMVLAMICGFLPALNIVGEKENGTIEQMNVTPVKKLTFIISKLIPYWLAGYVVLTIGIAVAYFAWNLIPVGFVGTLYLFVTIFILAFSGFGLVISNYAVTVQQAMFMMFFFVLTFIFMSGLYTPVDNMPDWAQFISHFSPLKYIIQVLRMVYLKGSGFYDLLPQFAALCGFAIFFNGWAVISYRKSS